jgi:hypothetical protein
MVTPIPARRHQRSRVGPVDRDLKITCREALDGLGCEVVGGVEGIGADTNLGARSVLVQVARQGIDTLRLARSGAPSVVAMYTAPMPRAAMGSAASSGKRSGSTTRRLTPKTTRIAVWGSSENSSSVYRSVSRRRSRSKAGSLRGNVRRTSSGTVVDE